MEALAPPGVLLGCRAIAAGDETGLLPDELPAWARSPLRSRQASGAARIVARDLLARLGHPRCPLPRTSNGAPGWPPGFVGALAHDEAFAVAAVALRRDVAGLGVDVEPAEDLPGDLLDLVATPRERTALGGDLLRARGLFAAKEAVFKAVGPLDGTFLEFGDVEVDLATDVAVVRGRRAVALRVALAPRIVAVAFIAAAPS